MLKEQDKGEEEGAQKTKCGKRWRQGNKGPWFGVWISFWLQQNDMIWFMLYKAPSHLSAKDQQDGESGVKAGRPVKELLQ